MALSARRPVTILSADSRQIYRGFDIGTAKPTPEDRDRVPHFGVDVVAPAERYSAARWAAAATTWIAEAERKGRVPVVVGGTGFYVRALTAPLFEEPPLDPGRRRALAIELAPLAVSELRRWCRRLDPARAHLGRAQLLRAIEVAVLTGVPISHWHRRSPRSAGMQARYLVVDPGGALESRIISRIDTMLESGWEDEVRSLIHCVPDSAPAWNATGYRAVREHVDGRRSRADAIERVRIDTRQYAKRQRTWLRHQLPPNHVTLLDPTCPDALRRAETWWETHEPR